MERLHVNHNSLSMHGIKQFKGSCYFNSVFNAFLLGSIGRKLLYNAYLEFKMYLINNNKQDMFFDYIHTLMTQNDFCIQSNDPNTLRMYFFAFISILMCHKVTKKISSNNVDNLMVSIGEQRIPCFGTKVHMGGYSLQSLVKLTNTMGLPNPMIISNIFGQQMIHVNGTYPLILVSELKNNDQKVPKTLHVHDHGIVHEYILDHAVLQVFSGQSNGHAVICSMSNGQPIIYDSNQDYLLQFDWTKLDEVKSNKDNTKILQKYLHGAGTIERFEFLYVCYVANDYITELEDIPIECEWSGNVNNTAHMIQRKLQLVPDNIYHVIVYDDEFLQNMLFHADTTMKYQNIYFYRNINDRIPCQFEQNIISTMTSDVHVYVICSQDCQPTTRRFGSVKPNKMRIFIERLKSLLRKLGIQSHLFVNQVSVSGVDLGFIQDVVPKYHKII